MANHKSAAKRARQTLVRNTVNRARRSKVQKLSRAVDAALATKGADVKETLRAAESGLARAAGAGTLHRKTAARKVSRLAKKVKKAALASKKA